MAEWSKATTQCSNNFLCIGNKLLPKSINGSYHFEQILGNFLSSLDTDDTENGLENDKNDTKR